MNYRPGQIVQHQRPCPRQPKPISAPRMLLTLALGLLLSWAAYSCQHREKGSAVNVEQAREYSETL